MTRDTARHATIVELPSDVQRRSHELRSLFANAAAQRTLSPLRHTSPAQQRSNNNNSNITTMTRTTAARSGGGGRTVVNRTRVVSRGYAQQHMRLHSRHNNNNSGGGGAATLDGNEDDNDSDDGATTVAAAADEDGGGGSRLHGSATNAPYTTATMSTTTQQQQQQRRQQHSHTHSHRPVRLSARSLRVPPVFTAQHGVMRRAMHTLARVDSTLRRLVYDLGRAADLTLPQQTAAAVDEAHRQFLLTHTEATGPPPTTTTSSTTLLLPPPPSYAARGMHNNSSSSNSGGGGALPLLLPASRAMSGATTSSWSHSASSSNSNSNNSNNSGGGAVMTHTMATGDGGADSEWAMLVRRARAVAADEGDGSVQSVDDYSMEPQVGMPTLHVLRLGRYGRRDKEDKSDDDEDDEGNDDDDESDERDEGDEEKSDDDDAYEETDDDDEDNNNNGTTAAAANAMQQQQQHRRHRRRHHRRRRGGVRSLRMRDELREMHTSLQKITDSVHALSDVVLDRGSAWWLSALRTRDIKSYAIRGNYHARRALRWSWRLRAHLLLRAVALNQHSDRARGELVRLQEQLATFAARVASSTAATAARCAECVELQEALQRAGERRAGLQAELLVCAHEQQLLPRHCNEALHAELALLLRATTWPRELRSAVTHVQSWLRTERVVFE